MSSKIYHNQVTLIEHLIDCFYYIDLKPIVLSDVGNLNKYENLYITEMMFIQYKYLSHAVEMMCTEYYCKYSFWMHVYTNKWHASISYIYEQVHIQS